MTDRQATIPPTGTKDPPGDALTDQPPLARRAALRALIGCAASTVRLLWQQRIHLPAGHVGTRLRFADGSSARVYRETVVDRGDPRDPCVLVVEFRLRAVRGWGHAVFRRESLLNTPLFVGFPGFVSKLWLCHDERGRYRGLYEWDGPRRAGDYARALWRVLALVSVPGSIHYIVLPGLRRDELLARPQDPSPTLGFRATGDGRRDQAGRLRVRVDEDAAFLADQFVDLVVERATGGGLRGIVEGVDPGVPGPHGDIEPIAVGQAHQIASLEFGRAAPAGLQCRQPRRQHVPFALCGDAEAGELDDSHRSSGFGRAPQARYRGGRSGRCPRIRPGPRHGPSLAAAAPVKHHQNW